MKLFLSCLLGCCLVLAQVASAFSARGAEAPAILGFPVPASATGATSDTACPGEDALELINIDTLFYVDNRGLSRIFVDLNGHAFKLVTEPAEVRQSINAFLIPQNGEITLHIGRYIYQGQDNCMTVMSQGPPGSDAELIIGDLLLPGQHVAYEIAGLVPLAEQFSVQRYPNPSRGLFTITYEIPEARTQGVPVFISVYDATGRRVRVLVDDRRFPGRFTLTWDGTGDTGLPLASGVYICHITAEEFATTKTLTLVR